MKGTIQKNLFQPKLGKVLLKVDWELIESEGKIVMTNPRVDIPAARVKDFDARNHKAFRGEMLDPSTDAAFRALLGAQIGPIVSELKIDIKELLA